MRSPQLYQALTPSSGACCHCRDRTSPYVAGSVAKNRNKAEGQAQGELVGKQSDFGAHKEQRCTRSDDRFYLRVVWTRSMHL